MKKIISLFMVVLMVFSTAAIPGFAETITPSTSVEKELEIINPEIRGAGKTKKTKFGKSIYSNPISIYADNYDFDIYSVTIVSVELLNRYAKQKSKIKTKIEFVSNYGFYFHTNSPG